MRFVNATMINSRPETDLLLCCACVCADSEKAERIATLAQTDMDWSYLIWEASQHRMTPLLYWHLNTLCPEVVPKATMSYLREHFNANARRNLLLTGELLEVLELFSAHGILAIPYKGPLLAASVYGNLALRQAGDLDIMVHKENVPKVGELLVSHGYQPDHQLAHGQEILLPHSQYAFHRAAGRISLEIHWQFAPKHFAFPLDFHKLSTRLEPTSLGGCEIDALSPEDLLLILCVHGGKHVWEQLRWICDIAELIRIHQEMDWERIVAQAMCLGCERMLFLGILLARNLLGAALPESVLKTIGTDLVVKSLVAQAEERLFCNANGLFRRIIFHLRMIERWRDRVRYCFYSAVPVVNDRAIMSLPRFFSFVYYLLRPIRLFKDYGRIGL